MNHLPPTRIQRMFGEIAGWYDFLNHLLSMGIDRSWRRKTVQLVPPQDGAGLILDVCTGTADLALAYWKAIKGKKGISPICRRPKGTVPFSTTTTSWRCPRKSGQSPVRVIGTDFCKPMLEIGEKKCRRAGADDRVELIEADTVRLPFPDEMFQIVCVAFGLRNVSDPDEGLREMIRVCRSGGKVAVLEFSTPRNWLLKILYIWYFQYVLPRIGQSLARNTQQAYNYLPESVGRFPQGEAFAQRMRAAGLKAVEIHPFTFGIVTLYVGEK